MWAVCGPLRSATTFMLEAIAAWTLLTIHWNMETEWASRYGPGVREHFYETGLYAAGRDAVVKILNPDVVVSPPTRAILMIRDPETVARSVRKIGQLMTPEQVVQRQDLFRTRFRNVDEVHVVELSDLDALFTRLADCGWPVTTPSYHMTTRAIR